jgi:hypothetical protein
MILRQSHSYKHDNALGVRLSKVSKMSLKLKYVDSILKIIALHIKYADISKLYFKDIIYTNLFISVTIISRINNAVADLGGGGGALGVIAPIPKTL